MSTCRNIACIAIVLQGAVISTLWAMEEPSGLRIFDLQALRQALPEIPTHEETRFLRSFEFQMPQQVKRFRSIAHMEVPPLLNHCSCSALSSPRSSQVLLRDFLVRFRVLLTEHWECFTYIALGCALPSILSQSHTNITSAAEQVRFKKLRDDHAHFIVTGNQEGMQLKEQQPFLQETLKVARHIFLNHDNMQAVNNTLQELEKRYNDFSPEERLHSDHVHAQCILKLMSIYFNLNPFQKVPNQLFPFGKQLQSHTDNCLARLKYEYVGQLQEDIDNYSQVAQVLRQKAWAQALWKVKKKARAQLETFFTQLFPLQPPSTAPEFFSLYKRVDTEIQLLTGMLLEPSIQREPSLEKDVTMENVVTKKQPRRQRRRQQRTQKSDTQ